MLDFILDVKFGKSPEGLATSEDRWRCDSDWKTSRFLLSDRSGSECIIRVDFYGDDMCEIWCNRVNQVCL